MVTCTGKISLKLVSYINPNSRLSDGSCCDGVSCSNECDNYFKLCLTRPSDSRCALGYKQTSVLGDDSFDFGGSLGGGTSNPVVYGFTKWEVSEKLLFYLNLNLSRQISKYFPEVRGGDSPLGQVVPIAHIGWLMRASKRTIAALVFGLQRNREVRTSSN